MFNALHCVGFLLPGLRAAGFFPFRAERMRRSGREKRFAGNCPRTFFHELLTDAPLRSNPDQKYFTS